MKHKILSYFTELKENTLASFVGLFINTKPKLILSDIEDNKKKIIEEKISHILEKSKEIEEVLPDFGEKYLYAEGEDFALFIYFVKENVAIASVFLDKPKFAAILLEHEILAKKIKDIEDIESIDFENLEKQEAIKTTPEEKVVEVEKEEKEENKVLDLEHYLEDVQKYETEQEDVKNESDFVHTSSYEDFFETEAFKNNEEKCEVIKEEEGKIVEDIEEVPTLEDLIKESIEEYEKNKDKRLKENVKKERMQKEEYIDPIILEHIEKEFVKEIGPIAKLILNRKMSELNIDPNKLKTEDIITLIQELAKEIRIEEKKEKFINEVNDLL